MYTTDTHVYKPGDHNSGLNKCCQKQNPAAQRHMMDNMAANCMTVCYTFY